MPEPLPGPSPRSRTLELAGERSLETDWMEEARCAGSDLDFVPDRPSGGINPSLVPPLLAVCAGCPVKQQCLEYAMEQPHSRRYGIYGGTTPEERR